MKMIQPPEVDLGGRSHLQLCSSEYQIDDEQAQV